MPKRRLPDERQSAPDEIEHFLVAKPFRGPLVNFERRRREVHDVTTIFKCLDIKIQTSPIIGDDGGLARRAKLAGDGKLVELPRCGIP